MVGFIGAGFAAIFLAFVSAKATAILDGFDWLTLPTLCIAFGGGVTWFLLKYRSRTARMITALVTVTAVVAAGGWWLSNGTRRQVEDMLASICSDGMWTDQKATCYSRSGDYIVDHFSAFDPNSWHGWDELPDAAVVNLERVNLEAVALQGLPIASVGHVAISQPLGGLGQTIQIRMMTQDETTRFANSNDALSIFPEVADRQTLVAGASATNDPPANLIYCNLPARPFFYPAQGDIIAFKGVVIALGTVPLQGQDGLTQASYVTCSAAEIVGKS